MTKAELEAARLAAAALDARVKLAKLPIVSDAEFGQLLGLSGANWMQLSATLPGLPPPLWIGRKRYRLVQTTLDALADIARAQGKAKRDYSTKEKGPHGSGPVEAGSRLGEPNARQV